MSNEHPYDEEGKERKEILFLSMIETVLTTLEARKIQARQSLDVWEHKLSYRTAYYLARRNWENHRDIALQSIKDRKLSPLIDSSFPTLQKLIGSSEEK